MARNDGRIEKGQRISSAISARAWNRALEAADRVLSTTPGIEAGESVAAHKASNVIYVRNQTVEVPLGGVLRIIPLGPNNFSATADGTDEASERFRFLLTRPAYVGVGPEPDLPFAIALEPIAAGAVGRMAIGGIVHFRCRVRNLIHTHATPISGDVSQLQSASCGAMRLVSLINFSSVADAVGDNRNLWGML